MYLLFVATGTAYPAARAKPVFILDRSFSSARRDTRIPGHASSRREADPHHRGFLRSTAPPPRAVAVRPGWLPRRLCRGDLTSAAARGGNGQIGGARKRNCLLRARAGGGRRVRGRRLPSRKGSCVGSDRWVSW